MKSGSRNPDITAAEINFELAREELRIAAERIDELGTVEMLGMDYSVLEKERAAAEERFDKAKRVLEWARLKQRR